MPVDTLIKFTSKETIEKLRKICSENDLSMDAMDSIGSFVISEKDDWEGVGFVECLQNLYANDSPRVQKGQICLITEVSGDAFYISRNSKYPWKKNLFKPSTESAYVEQLRKEIFKRSMAESEGILCSDWIDYSGLNGGRIVVIGKDPFQYRKDTDTLYFNGVPVYQSGKWAKLKPKRIEVSIVSDGWKNNRFDGYDFFFDFCIKNGGHNKEIGQIGQFLASQLEAYLNNEIGKEASNE